MSVRKPHNDHAGYIAEKKSARDPMTGAVGHVIIYEAAEQNIDVGGMRYAVVCNLHGSIVGETAMPRARSAMKAPENFCGGCRGEA